jgi:LuxR family maltose regulon positive regulatory protein
VETATFAAALAQADGDTYNATALARRALDVAEKLHGFRPLVAADPAFHDLLRSSIGRWGLHEPLVARVLERASAPNAAPAVALTARELEVLRELPNLNTVDEIAEVLFVSVNTVKTHLRSLYRKLQVGSRRAAVAEARRLGLL